MSGVECRGETDLIPLTLDTLASFSGLQYGSEGFYESDGYLMAEDKDKTRRQILLQQVELLLEDRNLRALRSLLADQWESDVAEMQM